MNTKKIVALLLALVLILASCGGNEENSEQTEEPKENVENTDSKVSENEVENESTDNSKEKESEKATTDNAIKIGEPIEFEKFTITIKEFLTGESYDGDPILIVNYDWENTGEEANMPFMTFSLKGFQDGVETNDNVFVVDGVDLGIGQKEVKSGGKITDAQTVVGIDDMDKPLELELSESLSFNNTTYTYTIDDLNNL